MHYKSIKKEECCIKIQNLCKNYHNKPILKNVSFSVKKGTIHGFIGPNGAGKSTTLKSLMGLVIPQKGKIYIEGQEDKSILNLGYARAEPKFPDYKVEQIITDCITFLNLSLKDKKQLISLD
jgi:ABC-type multidrug transport system ATPase subunit